MLKITSRIYWMRGPVKKTRRPVSLQNDGGFPVLQISVLFGWIYVFLDL